MDVVGPPDVDARRDVLNEVVLEDDVLHGRPWRAAVLVSDREENREPVLGVRPVGIEHVAVDEHPSRVLQLEQVFTVQATPSNSRSPLLQASGFAIWLRSTSMSSGTRSGIAGSAPPNNTFSPAASR